MVEDRLPGETQLQLHILVTNNKPKQKIAEDWSGNLCFQKTLSADKVEIRTFAAHSASGVHLVFPVLVWVW